MLDPETTALFIAASLAINISPGPSILFASAVALSDGIRATLIAVTGMSCGILVHVFAAASGLSALMATSTVLFTAVKYLGAAYLVYLGLRTLLTPGATDRHTAATTATSDRTYFIRGFFVDLLNPKIGLFFLAFLPQFIQPGQHNAFQQTLLLGTIFIFLGWVVTNLIAITAAKGATVVNTGLRVWLERWIPGTVLIGLGIRLAVTDQ